MCCDGAYGAHIDDMQIVNEETGEEVDLEKVSLNEIETISDIDEFDNPIALMYFTSPIAKYQPV